MHHIIYLSRASAPLSDDQLHDLLLQARTRNAALEVTGLLLYGNQQFMQVLEGEEEAVRTIYESIKGDPRHQNVTAYADKAIEQRAFEGWAMAFEATSAARFDELTGYLVPAGLTVDATRLRQTDTALLVLLRSFVML
ncbi:BLUF domain-containing protein [Hymenobacter sp. BT559]|uniref:BLUF domain-containing protein n=1 Tax=Hymenobacter sp. BT559 TaxID=2795729 RepID=UPI0018EAA6FF|nr:BLUF domain-containing protein [Hymenobacter sp. BT559]MBJ6143474.1 BLUF domain-containing protein [Hymenobacter sp. BT559]